MRTDRKYQIDLLKIFATFMILILHILLNGALQKQMCLPQFIQTWSLELFCLPAVNIYVLITGFLCCDSIPIFNIKKLFLFYSKTVFYSITVFLFFCAILPNVFTFENITNSIFVISNNSYWYLIAYLILMILSPFLNIGINKISGKDFKFSILSLFVVMSIIPFLSSIDATYLKSGYSALWFIFLYFCGAYIKKYITINNIKKYRLLITIVSFIILVISVFLMFLGNFMKIKWAQPASNLLWGYNHPFNFIQALCIFLIFLTFEIKSKKLQKVLKWFSDKSYYIYIVHTQPVAWYTLTIAVASYLNINKKFILFDVLLLAIILGIISLVLCIIIEFLYKMVCNILKKLFIKHKI